MGNSSIMRKGLLTFILLFFAASAGQEAAAQVEFDGTMGARGALAGPDYSIPSSLGRQVGGNLFHSFAAFSLMPTESATFSGPADVQHIIARVTGGASSTIDGTLRSEIAGADLYLLNPAGILFGPQAQTDISGSLLVSSADALRLGTTGEFAAEPVAGEVLSAAPPAAFGFAGSQPGRIAVRDGALAVPEGESITLAGGEVELSNSGTGRLLHAPGGDINLVAVASPGEVDFSDGTLQALALAQGGAVTITNSTAHAVSSSADLDTGSRVGGGGAIRIHGGRFLLDGAYLESTSAGLGDGRGVSIQAQDGARLINGASVLSETDSVYQGGAIHVTTPDLLVAGGSGLRTATWNAPGVAGGRAGDITIQADTVTVTGYTVDNGDTYSSHVVASSYGSGAAGDITITAASLAVADEGWIYSDANAGGDGGHIRIEAEAISVSEYGWIATDTFGMGRAGRLDVQAGELRVTTGAKITSDTYGLGLAGAVTIGADDVLVCGSTWRDGDIFFSAIRSDTFGPGHGGQITVTAPAIRLLDGGGIETRSIGYWAGDGGDISLSAGSLTVQGYAVADGQVYGSDINASTLGRGAAGDILVSTSALLVADSGVISSDTAGSGQAGNIWLAVADGLLMRDGRISSESTLAIDGAGAAGNITIRAGNLLRMQGSQIATSSENADGGNITVDPTLVDLLGSQMTTSVKGGVGNGGNIVVAGDAVVLDASQLIANAYGGNGGNVTVFAGLFLKNPASILSASSALGVQGAVQLNAPLIDVSASLVSLTESFFDVRALLPTPCVDKEEDASSFVVRGRDGLPPSPASLLMSL